MSIQQPPPRTSDVLSPWQTQTLDALASVKRMQSELRELRRDLALRPHEMTGPTAFKLADAQTALDDLRTELIRVYQTI